jgi:hypothetical protein
MVVYFLFQCFQWRWQCTPVRSVVCLSGGFVVDVIDCVGAQKDAGSVCYQGRWGGGDQTRTACCEWLDDLCMRVGSGV